jgi:hypothetical protein
VKKIAGFGLLLKAFFEVISGIFIRMEQKKEGDRIDQSDTSIKESVNGKEWS